MRRSHSDVGDSMSNVGRRLGNVASEFISAQKKSTKGFQLKGVYSIKEAYKYGHDISPLPKTWSERKHGKLNFGLK